MKKILVYIQLICLTAILGPTQKGWAMETSSDFEQNTSEKRESISKRFPADIWNMLISLAGLTGDNLFLKELCRQVELADVHYDTIAQAYIPTLEYYPTKEDIATLLERDFKATTLDKTKFQNKVKAALQKYMGTRIFDRMSKHLESKDELFIKKCTNLYLKKLNKLKSMPLNQLYGHLSKLSLNEQQEMYNELSFTIKLIKSCQKAIHSNKYYAPLNKLYKSANFLSPHVACSFIGAVGGSWLIKIVSYCISNPELFSNFIDHIRSPFTFLLFSMVGIACTLQECDSRALLELDKWLEGEFKALKELQIKIQTVRQLALTE